LKAGVLEEAKFYGLTKAVEALEAIIKVTAGERNCVLLSL